MPDPGHPVTREKESHKLELSAGGTGYVGLDLKAFEAEVSVSYVHVLSFEGVKNPFDKVKYGLKYMLGGRGRATSTALPAWPSALNAW